MSVDTGRAKISRTFVVFPAVYVLRMKCLFTLVFVSLALNLSAEHLSVAAEKGDGVYSLLRRYLLLDYGCNLEEFRQLNELKKNSILHVGRQYKLPIEIYTYNGRSIRSTTDNGSWQRAVAIRDYNDSLLMRGVRAQDFRKDNILYVPFHVDNCPEDFQPEDQPEIIAQGENAGVSSIKDLREERPPITVPTQITTSGDRSFSIFGEGYAKVPLIDRTLAGRVFYVVAGHGGPDPGAVGKRAGNTLAEDEYAYDVALRLTRNILQRGGTPYMIVRDENDGIRDATYLKTDKDETVWGGASIPRSQKERLFQRSDIINALYDANLAKGITDQTMIAIHVDSRQRGERIDVFFYYPEGDLIGAKQADRIHRTMAAKYDQYRPGRGYEGTVQHRDLHMLRETKPSGVYIELGNISNGNDQQRIVLAKNRQLLADWILQGLME